ncbi:hypothetical protein ABEF93_002146 [Exophiala dermatitidis]
MEATIAEGDVCQVIAHQLLKDLGESHRIKEATEDNSPCPHHEGFVGKVSLRVQNKSLSFSEREEFCVVEGDSRMLVLNMPMPEQDNTPAILPIGLFASTTPRKEKNRMKDAKRQRKNEDQQKYKENHVAAKEALHKEGEREEQEEATLAASKP